MTRARTSCAALLMVVTTIAAGLPASAQVPTVFDSSKLVTQMTGTWYEVGEYGVKRERNCVSDTVLLIAPGNTPNQMLFVDSCNDRKRFTDEWSSLVFWKKGTQPTARLKVRTLPLLSRPLVVVGLLPGSWMLLGTPNHKSLLLYSRTVALPEATLTTIKATASGAGYTGTITPTPQPNR